MGGSVFARWSRQLLLAQARRVPLPKLLARSRADALRVAAAAARHSRAYRSLLLEGGVQPAQVSEGFDFAKLPVLTKDNTFGRFSLDELAVGLDVKNLSDVLTSSGRGGRIFGFKLATRRQHGAAAWAIDLGLQETFDVDNQRTLLVNCLPMGVVFQSKAVTVANVSVREDMAVAILKTLGPKFDQVIVCTDPLFVRRVLDEARRCSLDWSAIRVSMILGEETLVESQRDYIAREIGVDPDRDATRLVGSSFGVGELGLNLLFETRETIRLRRAIRRDPALGKLLLGIEPTRDTPSIFCYNPLRCHVEVANPNAHGFGELCFTLNDPGALIPLPRYKTGDWGRMIEGKDVAAAGAALDLCQPWLPIVAMCGRTADRLGDLPSVEAVKELVYSIPWLADQLSGAFRITRTPEGRGRVELQGSHVLDGVRKTKVEAMLSQLFKDREISTEVCILAASAFPDCPTLDFERKFSYRL